MSARVTESGWVQTPLGLALRIQIARHDLAPMSFDEVWRAFSAHYPGKWALQCFAPAEHHLDQASKYHLHVLDAQPGALDLFDPQVPRVSR